MSSTVVRWKPSAANTRVAASSRRERVRAAVSLRVSRVGRLTFIAYPDTYCISMVDDGQATERRIAAGGEPEDFGAARHLVLRGTQRDIGRALGREAIEHF